MSNYYEHILNNIHELIEEEKYTESFELINQELSMPYIPEKFEASLREFLKMIPSQTNSVHYFNDAQSIYEAFFANEEMIHKAFESLEHSNLRNYWDELLLWFEDPKLHDAIKKHLLLLAINQEIKETIHITFEKEHTTLDLSQIQSIEKNQAYLECFQAIRDKLESDNPSMMIFALELLNQEVFSDFPFYKKHYDSAAIITQTENYLGL